MKLFLAFQKKLIMDDFIPVTINNDEILVKFLFDRDFKNKNKIADKLIKDRVFCPNKGGVSLQRIKFTDENCCKQFALEVEKKLATSNLPRLYCGFIFFKKTDFEEVLLKHKKIDFSAILEYTPLEILTNLYIRERNKVKVCDDINYGHSDIVYINPMSIDEEIPNTPIRLFSDDLSQQSKIVFDDNTSNIYTKAPLYTLI